MKYEYDDGGKLKAGFRGVSGDCVARSVAIATGISYKEIYLYLADQNAKQKITKKSSKTTAGKKTARNGIDTKRKWFKDYMSSLGFQWVSLTDVGKYPCCMADIPSNGVFIARQRRHYVAVVDGVARDIFDSSKRPVYGVWEKI